MMVLFFIFFEIVEGMHPSRGNQAQGGRLISGCIPRLDMAPVASGLSERGNGILSLHSVFLTAFERSDTQLKGEANYTDYTDRGIESNISLLGN